MDKFDELHQFTSDLVDPKQNTPPHVLIEIAAKRTYRLGYAQGASDVLGRMQSLASILPSSVTKARILQLLQNEIEYSTAEVLQKVSPE